MKDIKLIRTYTDNMSYAVLCIYLIMFYESDFTQKHHCGRDEIMFDKHVMVIYNSAGIDESMKTNLSVLDPAKTKRTNVFKKVEQQIIRTTHTLSIDD